MRFPACCALLAWAGAAGAWTTPALPAAARAAVLVPVEADGFRVVERREYYRVDASELRALRGQLDESRTRAGFDGKSVGLTRQTLDTQYRLQSSETGCALADLAVTVEITIHLPEWVPAEPVKPALRERWSAMLAGLTTHEEGHRDNAVAAGRELHARLKALPALANCLVMSRAAQREAFRAQARFQLRDRNYDRRTRHGVTQGSML